MSTHGDIVESARELAVVLERAGLHERAETVRRAAAESGLAE